MSKRSRLRWGIGILVAMVVCAAIGWVCLFSNPLSGIDEVSKVAAFGFYGADGEPVKFDVPVEYWPRIKAALGIPTRDFFPAKWVRAGSLDVTTRTGRKLCVTLYRTDFSIGAFAAGPSFDKQTYYRGGNSLELHEAMSAAYQAAKNLDQQLPSR